MTNKSPEFDFKVTDAALEDLIGKYCKDLTRRWAQGRLDPVIGRDEEVEQITTVLLQRGRGNVALLGEAGVGKTAMFVAVAQAFAEGKVPGRLKGGRVIEIDMGALGAGTGNKQDMEERLVPLIQGVSERNEAGQPMIVLCIDEIHSHFSGKSLGAAETLKPYLTEGNLRVIGATTQDEYDRYLRSDEALDRRFQKITLDAPDLEETKFILNGLRDRFETFHRLKISEEMIDRVVYLADKYMSKARQQPDKSLVVLDAACARAVTAGAEALGEDHIKQAVAVEARLNVAAID